MTWGGEVEFDETEHLNQLAHGDDVYAITPLRFTLDRPLVRTF